MRIEATGVRGAVLRDGECSPRTRPVCGTEPVAGARDEHLLPIDPRKAVVPKGCESHKAVLHLCGQEAGASVCGGVVVEVLVSGTVVFTHAPPSSPEFSVFSSTGLRT